jgi:hypothetical protein
MNDRRRSELRKGSADASDLDNPCPAIRVAAALRPALAALALERGQPFPELVHCLLARSLGLPYEGQASQPARPWRTRNSLGERQIVWLRAAFLGPLVEAAQASGWTLADETNSRLHTALLSLKS